MSAQSANATQGGLLTTYVLTRNLSKDRLELNRESLFEGGAMSGNHGNGNDLK